MNINSDLENIYTTMITESLPHRDPQKYINKPKTGTVTPTFAAGIEVKPYPQSRFWAIYENGELLAVVVYKKGAYRLAERLTELKGHI